MKKVIAAALCLALAVSFAGCAANGARHGQNDSNIADSGKTPTAHAGTAGLDQPQIVQVNGTLYLDTGENSTVTGRCGNMDGEITSSVARTERPTEDDQSNFGAGYGYQYGAASGTIEIFINNDWRVFAAETNGAAD